MSSFLSTNIQNPNSQIENTVILIDMDDTILQSSLIYNTPEIREEMERVINDIDANIPDHFFIPGALEFIKEMQQKGIKIGVVSHAFPGMTEILIRKLCENDITLNSMVNLDDVYNELALLSDNFKDKFKINDPNTHPTLINSHGKNNSDFMAKLSFCNMEINLPTTPKLKVFTIGDRSGDLMFSYHVRNYCESKGCTSTVHPVNIRAVDIDIKASLEVFDTLQILRKEGITVKIIDNYEDLRSHINICMQEEVVEKPILQEKVTEELRFRAYSSDIKTPTGSHAGNILPVQERGRSISFS